MGGHLLLVKDNEDLVQQVVNDERGFLSLVKDADNLLHLLVKDDKDLVHQVFNDELGHPQRAVDLRHLGQRKHWKTKRCAVEDTIGPHLLSLWLQ